LELELDRQLGLVQQLGLELGLDQQLEQLLAKQLERLLAKRFVLARNLGPTTRHRSRRNLDA
jgi:uncharacterized lipoprotein YmbA